MDPSFFWTALSMAVAAAAVVYSWLARSVPSRLKDGQAPRSEFGLVRADSSGSKGTANGVDIIFVHGLGSNPDTTWGKTKLSTTTANQTVTENVAPRCWITDFLAEDLECGQGHTRLFFYNYDTYWKRDAVQTRLENIGSGLLARVSSEIRVSEEERTRSIVFVGHSYGGLVVKQALIQARARSLFANIADHTRAALFLGVPHRGSSFSTPGKLLALALRPLQSNPSILSEVAYDSIPLMDLHDAFIHATGDRLEVVNFFEERPTPLINVPFWRWGVFTVTEQSATYSGANVDKIGLPEDHFGLNKFAVRAGPYKIVMAKLSNIVSSLRSQRRNIYSVPYKTVDSYSDRHTLSAMVKAKLHESTGTKDIPHALLIHGMGGTGKTQVALKYAQDHATDYNPLLWIDAQSEESIRSSFERCAVALRLHVERPSNENLKLVDLPAVQAVLHYLHDRISANEEWLVIVDNADDLTWEIRHVLPHGPRGNLIITSQDQYLQRLLKGCEEAQVGTMDPSEARNTLLKHLDLDMASAPSEVLADCEEVAHQLGYLALAVDLAGSYIANEQNRTTAARQYLVDYRDNQDELLRLPYYPGLSSNERTVWTAWDTVFKRIERQSLVSGTTAKPTQLLAFLARFHGPVIHDEIFRLASIGMSQVSEGISREDERLPEWLMEILKTKDGGWNSFLYRQSLDVLVRYGLVQRTGGDWPGVTLHSLVKWRATKTDEHIPWESWHLLTLAAVVERLGSRQEIPHFRRHFMVHLPDLAPDRLKKYPVTPETLLRIVGNFAVIYITEGRLDDGKRLQLYCFEVAKETFGEQYDYSMIEMMEQNFEYVSEGKWEHAEKMTMKSIETQKRKLGEEHPYVLGLMMYLSQSYDIQGRREEAEKLAVQVVEARESVLGKRHPDTLRAMLHLGEVCREQGKLDDAEELESQVLTSSKEMLGEEHPDTLGAMNALGRTYSKQRRLDDAEELRSQALKLKKKVLGEEHHDTLAAMNELSLTYFWQARLDDAQELGLQALKLREKVLGEYHPSTLSSMQHLAFTQMAAGQHAAGLRSLEDCVARTSQALGSDLPESRFLSEFLQKWKNQTMALEPEGGIVGDSGSTFDADIPAPDDENDPDS